MGIGGQPFAGNTLGARILGLINLRPGELGRTALMFSFSVLTSIGVLWFEASTNGLFLEKFGASYLPCIYLASMLLSIGWSMVYTWLQRYVPLRWVIVLVAVIMALPLPLFVFGLDAAMSLPQAMLIGSITLGGSCVLGMSLWLQAIYVLNDLNAAITANQLFNIREIKRTYPLISSGVLVADILSGFSLPVILNRLPARVGLQSVILFSFGLILAGAGILFFVSHAYPRYFPASPRRRWDRKRAQPTAPMPGDPKQYCLLLFIFFILAEGLFLLVDFQFKSQLENPHLLHLVLDTATPIHEGRADGRTIASFIGAFQGVLGFLELAMQWGLSSRVIEQAGIFRTASVLPLSVLSLGSLTVLTAMIPSGYYGEIATLIPKIRNQEDLQFLLMIGLKFIYELLHFTLLASISPVLFQPIPDRLRSQVQATVRGTAEPIATGIIGVSLVIAIGLGLNSRLGSQWPILLSITGLGLAALWLAVNWLIREDYLRLLVFNAVRGEFKASAQTLREFKREALTALSCPQSEAEQQACLEMLDRIEPHNAGQVLVPALPTLTPVLQQRVLEVILRAPDIQYLDTVKQVLTPSTSSEVVALALRYVYQQDAQADLKALRRYLHPQEPPEVRGSAAALLLERGNSRQKAEATNTLRLMLTHKDVNERLMGCRALSNLNYLQALQLYVPGLLNDPSLQVRRAVLDAIATSHLEKSYESLIQALYDAPTRQAAAKALVRLGNEAVTYLEKIVDDRQQSDNLRSTAWSILGEIETLDALDLLIHRLMVVWGNDRRDILRALVKIPEERGIDATLDRLGRDSIELLIDQELMLIAQTKAGILDLIVARLQSEESDMLYCALRDVQSDCIKCLFMLMQFLYEPKTIQAAQYHLQSGSLNDIAQGLEILDNQLNIVHKRALLALLDHNPELDQSYRQLQAELSLARKAEDQRLEQHVGQAIERLTHHYQADLEKQLQPVSGLINHEMLPLQDRISQLLELRHFLSDGVIAGCFQVARQCHWDLPRGHILSGLHSSKGFVRKATLLYLQTVHPRALKKVLPKLRNDPDRMIRSLVQGMMGLANGTESRCSYLDDTDLNTATLDPTA
jgi:HEAT repeat protein